MVLYFLSFGFLVCKFDNIKKNRAAKWLLKNAGVCSHCQVFLFYKLQVIFEKAPVQSVKSVKFGRFVNNRKTFLKVWIWG